MKIRVRKAKPEDRKLFLKLFKEHLEAIEGEPGRILPTEKNLEVVGRIFDTYVNKDLQGIVLLVAQDAFLIHGEQGPPLFETNLGKTATSWGVYVREPLQRQGVYQAMYKRAKKLLKEMEFDSVIGFVMAEGGPGLGASKKVGFKTTTFMAHLDLHEEEE